MSRGSCASIPGGLLADTVDVSLLGSIWSDVDDPKTEPTNGGWSPFTLDIQAC